MAEFQNIEYHIKELQKRVIWVLLALFLSAILGFIYAQDIYIWVVKYHFKDINLISLSPASGIQIYMQISLIFAFVITSPVILYQIWRFVSPGLSQKEKKATLYYLPVAIILLLLGLSFGFFYVFKYLLDFMEGINKQMGLSGTHDVYKVFSIMTGTVFPLALFFELPVVSLFLTRIRVITPQLLVRIRKYAYLGIVIVAAVITPPDFFSNIIVSIPLIILYEFSLIVSMWLYKRLDVGFKT